MCVGDGDVDDEVGAAAIDNFRDKQAAGTFFASVTVMLVAGTKR